MGRLCDFNLDELHANIYNVKSKSLVDKEGSVYCLKLRGGGYVLEDSRYGIMEVSDISISDTFKSIVEAEIFCRERWLDAEIIGVV